MIGTNINVGCNMPERFNVLVVGSSNVGKKSLVRALLSKYKATSFTEHPNMPVFKSVNPDHRVQINHFHSFQTMSASGGLKFSLYTTSGYDDYIDNREAVNDIKRELESRHHEWLNIRSQAISEEKRLSLDNRVHCLLYLVGPHGMKEIDELFIRSISGLVPIVPIIYRSDGLLTNEARYHTLKLVEDNITAISLNLQTAVGPDTVHSYSDMDPEVSRCNNSSNSGSWCCYDFNNKHMIMREGETASRLSSHHFDHHHHYSSYLCNNDNHGYSRVVASVSVPVPVPISVYPTSTAAEATTVGIVGCDPGGSPLYRNQQQQQVDGQGGSDTAAMTTTTTATPPEEPGPCSSSHQSSIAPNMLTPPIPFYYQHQNQNQHHTGAGESAATDTDIDTGVCADANNTNTEATTTYPSGCNSPRIVPTTATSSGSSAFCMVGGYCGNSGGAAAAGSGGGFSSPAIVSDCQGGLTPCESESLSPLATATADEAVAVEPEAGAARVRVSHRDDDDNSSGPSISCNSCNNSSNSHSSSTDELRNLEDLLENLREHDLYRSTCNAARSLFRYGSGGGGVGVGGDRDGGSLSTCTEDLEQYQDYELQQELEQDSEMRTFASVLGSSQEEENKKRQGEEALLLLGRRMERANVFIVSSANVYPCICSHGHSHHHPDNNNSNQSGDAATPGVTAAATATAAANISAGTDTKTKGEHKSEGERTGRREKVAEDSRSSGALPATLHCDFHRLQSWLFEKGVHLRAMKRQTQEQSILLYHRNGDRDTALDGTLQTTIIASTDSSTAGPTKGHPVAKMAVKTGCPLYRGLVWAVTVNPPLALFLLSVAGAALSTWLFSSLGTKSQADHHHHHQPVDTNTSSTTTSDSSGSARSGVGTTSPSLDLLDTSSPPPFCYPGSYFAYGTFP